MYRNFRVYLIISLKLMPGSCGSYSA
jgi:hypothetical protein